MDHREFFHDVHDAYPEPTKWIINEWLPVGLQVIGAPPKNFKSTVADAAPCITAQWDCGALPSWADLAPSMEGPSVILSGDATTAELNWLFTKGYGCQTKPETIFVNDDPWDFKLDNPRCVKILKKLLDDIKPRILLIDPFRKFISGDENDSTYIEDILYPWRKWAIDNESAVVLVHHLQKDPVGASTEDLLDPARLRGSGVLFANADSVLMCRCLNRFSGVMRISAIFKRGAPWDRTIQLGVPGYGDAWQVLGSEVMTDNDKRVANLHKAGVLVEKIASQLHIKREEVAESIAKIERNG